MRPTGSVRAQAPRQGGLTTGRLTGRERRPAKDGKWRCLAAANPSLHDALPRGMLEGSNRSRVMGIAPNSARDLFEAGLNEAASG